VSATLVPAAAAASGPAVALIVGVSGGLYGGGKACLQHLAVRWMLARKGLAPWRYVQFLDFSAERLIVSGRVAATFSSTACSWRTWPRAAGSGRTEGRVRRHLLSYALVENT